MLRFGINKIGLTIFVAVLAFGSITLAQQHKVKEAEEKIRSSKEELEKLEGQIKKSDKEARGLKAKEKDLLSEIHTIEKKIDSSRKSLGSLSTEIDELSSEIDYLGRQLTHTRERLNTKKSILNRRLREIYKRGKLHQFSVLLGSHSFTDMLKRFKYLTLIATQDKRLVGEVNQLRQSYEQYKLANERKLIQKVERKNQLEKERKQLENSESEREKLLGQVKTKRSEVLKSIERREAEREMIQKVIAEWEKKRKEAIELAKREGRAPPIDIPFLEGLKGNLNWPVDQGKLLRPFGQYVDNTTHTRVINNGIDIQSPAGASVFSVGEGQIMFIDWFRSYGKTVMIEHGGGMRSIYSHLGDVYVEVGQMVRNRQVIAQVGSTGSLEGPKLHFEIRQGAKAIDPETWLSTKR